MANRLLNNHIINNFSYENMDIIRGNYMGIIGINKSMSHYELYLIDFTIAKTTKIDNLFKLKKEDSNTNTYKSIFILKNPLLTVFRHNESILSLDSDRFYLKYSPLDCNGNSDNSFHSETKSLANETSKTSLHSSTFSVANELIINDNIIINKLYKIHYSPINYMTCQFTTGLTSLLNLYVTRANIELIYENHKLFYTICRYDNTKLDDLDSEIDQEEAEFEMCL